MAALRCEQVISVDIAGRALATDPHRVGAGHPVLLTPVPHVAGLVHGQTLGFGERSAELCPARAFLKEAQNQTLGQYRPVRYGPIPTETALKRVTTDRDHLDCRCRLAPLVSRTFIPGKAAPWHAHDRKSILPSDPGSSTNRQRSSRNAGTRRLRLERSPKPTRARSLDFTITSTARSQFWSTCSKSTSTTCSKAAAW